MEDLHIIFQLALVQALNCTYGVHPNGREDINPGSRYGGYPIPEDFFYRCIDSERPAEQPLNCGLLGISTRTLELAVAHAPG